MGWSSFNKKQVIIVTYLTCLSLFSYAQSIKDNLGKADRYYQKNDYQKALQIYLDALPLQADDADINFKIGMCYFLSKKIPASIGYLEKAYTLKPEVDPNIDYYLGMALQHDHQYARASKHYAAFKINNRKLSTIADKKIMECSIGDSLLRHPANVEIHPLSEINTSFTDFSPLVSGDGQTLIFTSNRSSDDYKIKSGGNFEDVYITEKKGDQWEPPKKVSDNIDYKFNNAATYFSPDRRTLYLYYEVGEGDIYTSTFENGLWAKPVPLNNFVNNPRSRESAACVSADGEKLFFSSNRPGGKGGFDLYICEIGQNGQWGRPSNLGSSINTRGNEEAPYLHPDGVTLYFSSNGHASLGSNDIFKSEFQNGHWAQPENLGYPINGSEYDGYFTISDDKKTGYYSTWRNGEPGNADIYRITFHDQKKEDATIGVASAEKVSKPGDTTEPLIQPRKDKGIVMKLIGSVIDVNTSAPLSATIRLVDNQNNKVIAKFTTDDSGKFELLIPQGGNYGVSTEKKGYLFNSIHYDLPPFEKYQEIDTQIRMVKAEVGSKVILKNIFFDVNQSELKHESLAELESIRDLLLQNPHLRVQINGHTDNTGYAQTNLILSLKRAESVIQYLIKQGIAPARLVAKGYGSERPLVSNDDESGGRQINRRTEIEILEPAK